MLEQYDIEISFRKNYQGPYFHHHTENPFIRLVAETYIDTRIYVMLGQPYEFVGLMDHLYDRGLLDTGEYFVVGVHLGQYDPRSPQSFLQGIFDKNVSINSQRAFRYFIGVVHSPPVYPEYETFTKIVNDYLEKPPFNYPNPYKDVGGLKILRPEAAYLYDAVWLYARAARAAMEKGYDLTNGTAIIDSIKGKTYKSAMGYISRINSVGDAEGNFSLVARDQLHDASDDYGLFPVGVFLLNENFTALPAFNFYDGKTIDWHYGMPPVDEPPCGYREQFCIPPKTYTREIVAGVVGGLALVVSIIGYLAYRNWRYEQELASLLWKIDLKDITLRDQFVSTGNPNSNRGRRTIVRASSQLSLGSQADLDGRQLFTSVGTYKGNIVAIIRVNKKHVELTRNVKKELKCMRDLRHDNINPFIGACIDPPNIFIVTNYCSKGSLQDILENDDLQLDDMFMASFIFDIVRGMIYLHESEIRCHGKLKSSNCLVDNRMVLKITDFGLHEFLGGENEEVEQYALYRSLLWRAPELLRSNTPRGLGTQQGDVYSFAIIVYEIYCRRGPYGDIDLSPVEIVSRVMKQNSEIPFRPRLAALETAPKFVTDVIKECWDEDPNRRPEFKIIRCKLKPLQKGMKPNILDNMMAIMEKYASNLEALVEERTDQLTEEKKKTEELLLQMLPRPVAEALKRGKEVEAEAFDCVTIYFSDICGFTAMSSESTPMQIVSLLNDLYTLFDSIIEHYDVYKVETIGDAYMCVSGLPKRNGIIHAGEIASMSLHLLREIQQFRIRHRPNDTLKLRIGIHSGPCVAGVVGLKMPRYCLFGDTVNTCSRMESTGLPLMIHCSPQTRELLLKLGGYTLEQRGLVQMKGKGEICTFWLTGEDAQKRASRFEQCSLTNQSPTNSGNNNKNYCNRCNCDDDIQVLHKHAAHLPHACIVHTTSATDVNDSAAETNPKRIHFSLDDSGDSINKHSYDGDIKSGQGCKARIMEMTPLLDNQDKSLDKCIDYRNGNALC
ncbi:hypothetical protein ACJMK2_034431 [Sinanodonta woodiana]|uniref:Guanylate cyclase n=1 Tax=Sinanodonta woodiana TaxID=1069815 RepID=A0ABD3WRK9_SINWO